MTVCGTGMNTIINLMSWRKIPCFYTFVSSHHKLSQEIAISTCVSNCKIAALQTCWKKVSSTVFMINFRDAESCFFLLFGQKCVKSSLIPIIHVELNSQLSVFPKALNYSFKFIMLVGWLSALARLGSVFEDELIYPEKSEVFKSLPLLDSTVQKQMRSFQRFKSFSSYSHSVRSLLFRDVWSHTKATKHNLNHFVITICMLLNEFSLTKQSGLVVFYQ